MTGSIPGKRKGSFILSSVIILCVISCLLPIIYVLAISTSSKRAILAGEVGLLPVEFNLDAYAAILKTDSIIHSLIFTAILTVVFTFLAMTMTLFAAYPLTKSRLRGVNVILLLMIFTMYFGGGIIPEYMLLKGLHLTNTEWVLILPGVISVFNLIILKSFILSLPQGLEESAYIDGCSDFGILFKIVLPLSMPVIATLVLFYAVGRWNGFQDALMFISKPELYPIQLVLYQIMTGLSDSEVMKEGTGQTNMVSESIKSASIIFATLPIVAVYPFLQKYFVSGVMIGAVKG
ncbi:MAG: ABC-type sugar transport system, permease component [Paenibacillaceae bacterium]|jgi:putative aldouronate transport system permease protein|nr:ABC-type sugar transport system, permease component [Paenibacillaceae bacterium]